MIIEMWCKMKDTVAILKALGDENRLRIIMMLRERTMCVCEIDEVLDIALSTISSHLKILKQAGLIVDQKEGRWINYHLNKDVASSALLNAVAEEVKGSDQVVIDIGRIQKITKESCSLS